MQDRYAFDHGDFSKLGLLRTLAAETGLRVGVLWYRNEALSRKESENGDGGHIRYLCPKSAAPDKRALRRWSACDADLYASLRAGYLAGERTVAALERQRLLRDDTVYFADPLPSRGEHELRRKWFEAGAAAMKGCGLVCCDPDNGLTWPDAADHRMASPKHLLPEEAAQLFEGGASLVIYHHPGRSASHAEQIGEQRRRLERLLPRTPFVEAVRYRRGTSRAYLLVAHPNHEGPLRGALSRFRGSPWFKLGHFE